MFMIGCSNEYSSFMNDCLTNKRAEKENTKEVKNDKRH